MKSAVLDIRPPPTIRSLLSLCSAFLQVAEPHMYCFSLINECVSLALRLERNSVTQGPSLDAGAHCGRRLLFPLLLRS